MLGLEGSFIGNQIYTINFVLAEIKCLINNGFIEKNDFLNSGSFKETQKKITEETGLEKLKDELSLAE